MRKKVHIIYAEHSSPNPSLPLSSLANSYCINFGTGSSDELLGHWRCPKTFRVYQLDILDMGKNYTLSTQIFHLQTHRTLS